MILNKSTSEIIDIKIKYADTFFKRFKGLLLKKDIDFGLVFTNMTGSSIHTMFMRFEIDVYFLDENKTIFEKASLKSWRFYQPKKPAKFILETKKDYVNLKTGDELKFI